MDGGPGNDELDGDAGADTLVDGDGDDIITGDEGPDMLYVGFGADRVFPEEDSDTIYLFADGSVDVIRCDDTDDTAGVASQGTNDQVIYIGAQDRLDVIWPTCDVVTTVAEPPAGWPYGPVVSTRTTPAGDWNLRARGGVLQTWH